VPRADLPFIAEFFIGLGDEVILEEPEELREAIRRRLSEMLIRYQGMQ
jgi:predicted DNA-binding transcriptional regulator YafY